MFRRSTLVMLLIAALVAACAAPVTPTPPLSTNAPAPEPQTLTVFAAASLTEVFTEIGKKFESAHSGVTVVYNFAGSNQLAQQIGQGAPADVFASANKTQMQAAIDSGRIISGTPQTFVRNRLALVFPSDNPAGIHTLQDLAKPGLKLVLAAKEAPVGQYALDFLDKAVQDPAFGVAFKDNVLKNVVSYEENVKAVLTKVALGEADAGIVYTSDITGDSASQVGRLDIPDPLNTIATYPIAALNDSANAELATAFVDYMLSQAGQAILVKYGFISAASN